MTPRPHIPEGVERDVLNELIRIVRESEIEARFESVSVNDIAERWLAAVVPRIADHARQQERERIREALAGLSIGTGPDRDERYQDAWRHGVSDARDLLLDAALDQSPGEEGQK